MRQILLTCFAVIICGVTHAQDIDGFILGEQRGISIIHVPRGFKYVTTGDKNKLEYSNRVSDMSDCYTKYRMTFENDKLYNIEKVVYNIYIEGTSQGQTPEQHIMDVYTNLIEQFGNPQTSNDASSYWYCGWELSDSRLSLRCSWTARQKAFPNPASPLWGPDVMKTVWNYDIKIKWTAKKNVNQIKPQISTNGNYIASGSGFILSSNGIIVTNYHVIDGATGVDVFVNRDNGVKKYKAKVLISDKTNDISLLQIDDNTFAKFSALPYAVKTTIQDVGTNVFALGYPMSNILGEEIKVTDGIISSKTGYQGDIVTYQISAPIQSGNSGGPLFDKQGNIVGITNAGVPDAQNVGYAIKTSYLKNLIDVAPTTIMLPANNSIAGLPFTEKIKRLTPYVVLIKIY